ncbi:MAG: 50S ribosomal protein L18e [Candidatus Woesearchaeota archaeon]
MNQKKYTKIKSNPIKIELINLSKKLWLESKKGFWKRIMEELEKPTRRERIVNLSKLDKICKDNEKVLVPGKVLGGGTINKPLTVVAFSFSESAKQKIEAKKGKAITLKEFMKNKPTTDYRIIG